MTKIKFISDTACDISMKEAEKLDITLLNIPINVDGKDYLEGIDFTNEEFYDLLKKANRIPVTAHILSIHFAEAYFDAYNNGYSDAIVVTINSKASAICDAAAMAKKAFFEEHPEATDFNIHLVDSLTYTSGYGYPIREAVKKAEKNVPIPEILDYLDDWFRSVEIYFAPYSLEFVKKSGRVNSTAAFVGELVGLRPIVQMVDGENVVIQKVRGDKSIIPTLVDYVKDRAVPGTPYLIVYGEVLEYAEELEQALTKEKGYSPEMSSSVGPCIAINAGPKIVGVIFKGKRRRD